MVILVVIIVVGDGSGSGGSDSVSKCVIGKSLWLIGLSR